jgi:hypothetical protein
MSKKFNEKGRLYFNEIQPRRRLSFYDYSNSVRKFNKCLKESPPYIWNASKIMPLVFCERETRFQPYALSLMP